MFGFLNGKLRVERSGKRHSVPGPISASQHLGDRRFACAGEVYADNHLRFGV